MSGAHTSIGIEAEGRRHRSERKNERLLGVRWIFYIGALCKFWANDGYGGHKTWSFLTCVPWFETFMPKKSFLNRKFKYDFRVGKLWLMTLTTSRNLNWVLSYVWENSFVSDDEWPVCVWIEERQSKIPSAEFHWNRFINSVIEMKIDCLRYEFLVSRMKVHFDGRWANCYHFSGGVCPAPVNQMAGVCRVGNG